MDTNKGQNECLKAPISKDVLKYSLDTSILFQAVKNPKGVPQNEWIAQKAMDLFRDAQVAWGFVSNSCHCPLMRAHFMVFKWQDNPHKAAVPLPATIYVKSLFHWIDSQIANTSLFPLKPGVPFSNDFLFIVKNLLRRLFRVYSHIYCHHWPYIESVVAGAHVNYCLKHFVFTCIQNNILDFNELKPLEELAQYIMEDATSNSLKIRHISNLLQNIGNDKDLRNSQDNNVTELNSPDTHIPSTSSLLTDSPLSEDTTALGETLSPESLKGEQKKLKENLTSKINSKISRDNPSNKYQISKKNTSMTRVNKNILSSSPFSISPLTERKRIPSVCSDSIVITGNHHRNDKSSTKENSRKTKTYPWTEFAKKLILCTKKKKKDLKL
ncbi:Mob1/phocein family protein [Cryptosporidium serpentis]